MTTTKESTNVLAIESAVGGGSAALFCRAKGIDLTRNGAGASRAEKIISVIAELLDECEVTTRDLDLVAVSTGPGSYSGIRIGVSTALGLARAVAIPCVGVSILESLAHAAKMSGRFAVAIPVGKNDVAWQAFTGTEAGDPVSAREAELMSLPSFTNEFDWTSGSLFAPTELVERLGAGSASMSIVDAGSGLAEYVGRYALSRGRIGERIEPIYLRNRHANRPALF